MLDIIELLQDSSLPYHIHISQRYGLSQMVSGRQLYFKVI
uniref:Uncharacterized protein n=1 Tax=Parascaris equorum TaxID=6256 RepID=A0A914RJB4_PAREQ